MAERGSVGVPEVGVLEALNDDGAVALNGLRVHVDHLGHTVRVRRVLEVKEKSGERSGGAEESRKRVEEDKR